MGPEPRRRCIARLAFAALLALAASPQLAAYSYRMISDEALLAQSPVVFTARVAEVLKPEPDAAGVVRETRYRLDVLGRHKGALPDEVVLALPGATSAHRGPRYAGIPRYEVGEILMLFAAQDARGDYRPMQLLLGVFRGMKKDGAELLVRPLDEEGAVDPGFNATYAQARDTRRFVAWVEATARGAVAPADYFAPVPQEAAAKFTQMYLDFGSAGRFPARWRQFDFGQSEPWFATPGGQAGMATDEYAQAQQALAAWTNDATSDIRFTWAGVAAESAGSSHIVWNDPRGEIAGSYDCKSGGTLALGGPYASLPGHVRNGVTYANIDEGDVVVQDGAGCEFDGHGGADGAETLAHELGHALGFGHACGDSLSPSCNGNPVLDDALMRAYIHADGRGASLRADDVAGAAFVYGPVGVATGRPDPLFANGFE